MFIHYRVSVVCSQFPPVKTGYARVAFEVDRGLEELGNEVKTVTVSRGCKRIWNFPFLTEEGKMVIKSSEAVIIIGPSPPFTEQAFKVAKKNHIPVIYVTNAFVGLSSYVDNYLARIIDTFYEKIIYRRHLNKSTYVFVQTEGFARYLGLKRTVFVAPYGLRKLPVVSVKDKEKRVLFVGQFRHYKGLRILLDAIKIMKSTGDSPVIDIAGAGPLLDWLQNKVRRNNLLDVVNIIVSPDDSTISDLYSRDRVLVLPSVSAESFGFVLLEAASHGMNIITSDLPGLADVSKFLGGQVVQRRNASLLAKKIIEALNSRAHKVADLSPFSWERNIRLLENAVDRAITEKEDYVHAVSAQN